MEEVGLLPRISESTVKKIVSQDIESKKIRKDLGTLRIFERRHADLIRRVTCEAYDATNIVLSISTLHQKVVYELKIHCCQESLRRRRFLHKIGFKISVIHKRQVIMENLRISEWRVKYLYGIQKLPEENTPIMYLDIVLYLIMQVIIYLLKGRNLGISYRNRLVFLGTL